MNIIVCTFTVLASFLVLHSHASTTIRIRQWNGQMRRLDVDIDSDNHRDVWQQILGASSSNSVVEIDGRRFNENDFLSAVASKGIVLKNGEIVNIIDPEKSMEKSEAAKTPKQATPKTSTKKVKTLKDIELARKSLIRIKRQKSDSRKLVVYNDSERILERLNTKGGIALLLSLDKDGLVDQRSNAHFICELYSGDIVKCLKEEISLFSRSALYKKILSLAEALKGTVVGCCISIGNDNSDFCDNNRHWSSFHILSALDIFSDFTFKSPFILSAAKYDKDKDKDKKWKRRKDPSKVLEFSLEAFCLSDQVKQLYDRGLISTILFRKELLDRDNKIDPQQLKLNGSVLVRSEELQSIDSIALAVPVPVITGKRRKQDKNGMVAHLFPTKNELMDSEVLATSVRYVAKLLRKLLVVSKQSSKEDMSDVAARLKDPHLLLFLQDYIDAVSFRQLCSFVIQDFGKKPLSVEVALSIDNAITMLDM